MYARFLICLCITTLHTLHPVLASTQILYWTKNYTSDLQWTIFPKDENTWEEMSGRDWEHEGNVRTYEICPDESSPLATTEGHWLRSPFIEIIDAKTIKLDVEFTITKCPEQRKCKETFGLFYYEAIDDKVASSTFPPWKPEEPYKKIATVAAKVYNVLNNETYDIGPIDSKRKGIHLAIQDNGGCIAIISIRVYYLYCREQVSDLARFPRTLAGAGIGDLIVAKGECVENAVMTDIAPTYHCNSVGEWKIQQGKCECKPGYHRQGNSCLPCRAGTYRSQGADECVPCPENSGKVDDNRPSQAVENCPCNAGFARARNENHTIPCTKPPSQPGNLTAFNVTERRVDLAWIGSDDSGGRDDLYYNVTCLQFDEDKFRTWRECPATIKYRMDAANECSVFGLQPYTRYRFKVTAENGASWSMPCGSIANCKVQEVDVKTKESKPGLVDNVSTSRRGPTSVTFTWPKPSEPNGKILGYEAKVFDGNGQIVAVQNVVEPQLTVASLRPSSPYQLRVRARTSAGYGPFSAEVYATETAKAEVDTSKIVMIVAAASFVVAIVLVVMFICYKRTGKLLCLSLSPNTKKRPEEKTGTGQATDEQIGLIVDLPPRNSERIYVEYKDPQQAIEKLHTIIQPNEIKVDEIIGTGEFAEVCCALLRRNGKTEKVAAKRLKSNTTNQDRLNFLREAATLAQFNDTNIVQLKGVVLSGSGTMIVTEYMDNKSLDQYLRLHKSDLLLIDLLKMQRGIASGMKYLANMKYVHRDLAARNILIDSKHCCKVSDFGLSRVLQNEESATYTTQGGKIAIRWTAPECIRYRSFTSASDVWSFGIVVWEIMSGGEKPYWDMTNDNVYINVQEGLRLPSPMDCPKAMHDLMLDCWAATPARRPTFPDLVRRIDRFIRGPEVLRTSSPASAVNSSTSFAHPPSGQELSGTPSLSRAIGQGQVNSVQTWLELQRLGNYRDQFEQCGIDSLEKVSNLTINDLKELGISVTFHINRLENGIRTLKRHMSTNGSGGGGGGTSPGLMMRSLSDASTAIVDNDSVFIATAKDVEAARA